MARDEVTEKNRRVVGILLGIVAALVVSAFLVGIRW